MFTFTYFYPISNERFIYLSPGSGRLNEIQGLECKYNLY